MAVHFGLIVIDSVDLAREIDAGLARVAERLEILVELIEPESLRRHHQRRVAGLLQTSREGDCAMPGGAVAGNRLAESLSQIPAGAVERVVNLDRALLESRRRRQNLEGRARLICLADALVVPHLEDEVALQLGILVAVLRVAAVVQLC